LHQVSTRNAIQALYVQIPKTVPTTKVMSLAVALAGIGHMYGLILASNNTESTLWEPVRFALQQQFPHIRLGTQERLNDVLDNTAMLIVVSPDQSDAEVRRAIKSLPGTKDETLLMIDNRDQTPTQQIVAQMNRLRALGIRNFGYAQDAWERDVPPVMGLIDAFQGHTIVQD